MKTVNSRSLRALKGVFKEIGYRVIKLSNKVIQKENRNVIEAVCYEKVLNVFRIRQVMAHKLFFVKDNDKSVKNIKRKGLLIN